MKKLLKHVAIIMDGNRRWARKRKKPLVHGYRAGGEALKRTIEHCLKLGIEHLTVFIFSTENWRRSKTEVNTLMRLFEQYIKQVTPELVEKKIRLNIFGSLDELPKSLQAELKKSMQLTKKNAKMTLNLAMNYGGRDEMVRTVRKIVKAKPKPGQITEKYISKHLYSAGVPDPELIIRTSGEIRLSGFLLWQSAYSELYFTGKLWPDFKASDLNKAILEWQKRKRRFGI
ncbi:di-trans,poly-cis-decaprenylcistransferase [Candidatus Saccharibacteria bacterium]|nr:di-trans,poly-cis-decaprenylcistransferase [Candidatus Saccharibacteria bacterium]NIW79112.1 di-trans,poly-cis-decaprenylcistransferase [Calditrichia bacterium]